MDNGGEYCVKMNLTGDRPVVLINGVMPVGSTVTFDIFLTYNTEDERADFNMTNSSGAGYGVDPDCWINGSKGCIWTNAWTTLSITVTEENIARLEIWIPVADSADFDLYTIYIDNVVVNVA